MTAARNAMVASRAAYLALIIWAVTRGEMNIAAFNAILFLGSGFLAWLGWRDSEYAVLDALVCLTFSSTIIVSLELSWATGLLGFDKIYHFLGGLCLGWFASLAFRGREGYPWLIIGTAFALGVAWEGLEFMFSLLPPPLTLPFSPYGWVDSAWDVVADTIGGGVVALVRRQ